MYNSLGKELKTKILNQNKSDANKGNYVDSELQLYTFYLCNLTLMTFHRKCLVSEKLKILFSAIANGHRK